MRHAMDIWAMILAAGQGLRLCEATGGVAKQFLEWRGAPLYWASARLFARCARVRGLVFVFPAERLAAEQERLLALGVADLGLPWLATAGGPERRDSVRLGLETLLEARRRHDPVTACDAVLVHDAARPFATPALVNRVMDALGSHAGVVPGVCVTDTIKEPGLPEDGTDGRPVLRTPARDCLRAAQTPQGFHLDALVAAHALARRENWIVTDDASLLERCGHRVGVVEGEPANRKITSAEDLTMLNERTRSALLPRTGWGYDVHRFASPEDESGLAGSRGRQPARPLRLGGVDIPGAPEVLAHSDGDVLLHALTDAVLGCAGGGDIGQRFPDSDPALSGCDSAVFADAALTLARDAGVRIVWADLTIIAQIPKIAPHREAIRRNVARLLGLDPGAVNLKATTEEGLGFTGEKRGIKAVAVVSAVIESGEDGPSGAGDLTCGC